MAKNLIIYYSRVGENYWNGGVKNISKGNTEIVAEFTQKAVGGDLFQVETVKEYAADYYACIDDAKAELNRDERPELKKYLDDISEYDNIVVAGPCWWGTYMLPLTMKLSRSGGHEYYASLPQDLNVTDAESTSHVNAGWLYYFKDWNAFALNFKEMDIAPYKVYVIAEISGGIENTLQDAPGTIEIRVLE